MGINITVTFITHANVRERTMKEIPQEDLPEFPEEFDGLNVYVVGGWVRDYFREGVEPSDVDLMVAGTTGGELLERGFTEIDSSNNDTFGVFQDSLGREVALAREERSTGDGHKDFDVVPISPEVPAREAARRDLSRRDFRINSMAVTRDGRVIDPYGGLEDLEQGRLVPVNEDTFEEDSLRILRGARFDARTECSLSVETLQLMGNSVERLDEIPQERVRMEMEKTFKQAEEPSRFFEVLALCGALEHTFPELEELIGVSAGPDEYHGESDTFKHTMMVLDEMAELRPHDEKALLAALSHDLGKAITRTEGGPEHGHDKEGVGVVDDMKSRLSMSNEQAAVMRNACGYHMKMHDMQVLNTPTVLDMAKYTDWKRMVDLAEADKRGRLPPQEYDRELAWKRLRAADKAIKTVRGQDLIDEGHHPNEMGGEEFRNLIRQRRVELAREYEGQPKKLVSVTEERR